MQRGGSAIWKVCAALALLLGLAFPSFAPAGAQTSASSHTTGYRYDIQRRLVGTISPDPDGSGTLKYAAARNTYDAAGRLVKVETGELATWQSQSIAPSAWSGFTIHQTVDTLYDLLDRKIKEVHASGGTIHSVTEYSYDIVGRLECTAVRMNPAAFNLSPPSISACTLGSQGSGAQDFGKDRITRNVYDPAGQLLKVQKAVGTPRAQDYVTYEYTDDGKQKAVIDANGNRAEFIWDGHNRQSHWYFPSKTAAGQINASDYEQYAYDASGNRLALRKRDGRVICQRYDKLNRVDAKFYRPLGTAVATCATTSPSGTDAVYYGYDRSGLQLYARFGSTSGQGITNSYDAVGRIATSTTNMGGTSRELEYQYDKNGNRTRLIHPDDQFFDYEYDGLDRLVRIKENTSSTPVITFAYDAAGRRSDLGRNNAPDSSYGYDGASRLTSLAHPISSPNALTLTFGYNPASQIVSRTASNDNYVFEGNVAINRTYAKNGLNQYTAAGAATLNYDDNGNLTYSSDPSGGTVNYTYDIENRVTGASGAKTAILVYDPLGRLFETSGSVDGTKRFLYDGDALVAEYDAAGALLRRYAHGSGVDEPLLWYEGSSITSAQRRFLYANHQGSIIAVTGAITTTKAYDPYGIPSASGSQPYIGRFQYTGQIYLPDLGLYHYKARAYSPTLGRFLQTDPVGYEDDVNLYAYVRNDPISGSDPTGEACETVTGSIICQRTESGTDESSGNEDHTFRDGMATGGAALGAIIGGAAGGTGGAAGGAVACAPGGPVAVGCAAVGGTAGAIEGAAVGGVAGALVGAVVGDAIDKGIALFRGDPAPKRNEGVDSTNKGAGVPVRQISRTADQVRQSLADRGFTQSKSGPAEIYTKGNSQFVIRPSKSAGSGVKIDLKVRGKVVRQFMTK